MRRRARAVAFAGLALVCAAIAASLAGDYRAGVEAQIGPLRPVVVARSALHGRQPLRTADARKLLEVRRIPGRFAPVDALSDPLQAIGRSLRVSLPAGAFVTASLLRAPGTGGATKHRPAGGREAIEVVVAGAGALAAAGNPLGRHFDVVATGEPRAGGPGRTRVVAAGVELLDLREAGSGGDPLGAASAQPWAATVAARRGQAIRLIQAHNYAREIRLIGTG